MSDASPPTGRRADRAGSAAPGRRGIVRPRRLDLLVVLSIVLPTVVVGALALVRGEDATPYDAAPPGTARLTDASVTCAAAVSSTAGDVVVTRVPGVDGGKVAARIAAGGDELGSPTRLDVGTGVLAPVRTDGDVVVTGQGGAAPGLVAGRTGEARAAAECRPPTFDEYYVGIGAGARQSSVIELVNPDAGPAVVEIALSGFHGLIPEDDLHGIRLAGYGVRRLDLSSLAPRRGTLAVHLTVVRGRVTTTVRHTYDPLGRSTARTDFLPSQPVAATSNRLLGVPTGDPGFVYLFNPGEDEVRATIQVISGEATFTPAGTEDVVVPAGTVRQVPLDSVLTPEAADGALGLEVVSNEPLVASARILGDDLGLIAATVALEQDQPTTAVVPVGQKALVLAGALSAGTVRVTALDARGRVLLDEKAVEVGADRGSRLKLPDGAVVVTISARNTPIEGTVALTGDRVGVLRLLPVEIDAQVPVVRPQ